MFNRRFQRPGEQNAALPLLHSNRSAVHGRVGEWVKALADTDECVYHNPTWTRGYSRRSSTLEGLGKLDETIAAYEKVLDIDTNNTDSKQVIEAVHEKRMKKKGGEDDACKDSVGVQVDSVETEADQMHFIFHS